MSHRFPYALLLIALVALPALAKDDRSTDARITKKFENADLRDVITYIAKAAKANVIVEATVSGKVTVDLQGTPWLESLRQIVRVAGYQLKEQEYGIYMVLPHERQASAEPSSDYYRFQHWRPKLPKSAYDDPADFESGWLKALRAVAALGDGALRWVPSQHAVVFTGEPATLRLIKSLAAGMDDAVGHQLGAPRPGTPAVEDARRTHYETLLRDAKSESAAKYFLDKLAELDKAKGVYGDLYGDK